MNEKRAFEQPKFLNMHDLNFSKLFFVAQRRLKLKLAVLGPVLFQ